MNIGAIMVGGVVIVSALHIGHETEALLEKEYDGGRR